MATLAENIISPENERLTNQEFRNLLFKKLVDLTLETNTTENIRLAVRVYEDGSALGQGFCEWYVTAPSKSELLSMKINKFVDLQRNW